MNLEDERKLKYDRRLAGQLYDRRIPLDTVQAAAKQWLDDDERIQVVLLPEGDG